MNLWECVNIGLRFRKSIKILLGVRLNINKNSMSLTAGFKGYHVTYNSKTGLSQTASIPGTGLSYTQRSSQAKRRLSSTKTVVHQEIDPIERLQKKYDLQFEKQMKKEANQYNRARARENEKIKKMFERSQRLTKRENDILDILKGITYHISQTFDIEYTKNDFYISFYYQFEPFWICRIALKGRKKFIIFPINENKTQMYEFKKTENIYDYSELIQWSATNSLNACLDIRNDNERQKFFIRQKRSLKEKAFAKFKEEYERKRDANKTDKEKLDDIHQSIRALLYGD